MSRPAYRRMIAFCEEQRRREGREGKEPLIYPDRVLITEAKEVELIRASGFVHINHSLTIN